MNKRSALRATWKARKSPCPGDIEPTGANSAVLERDAHDLHGQERKMSGGGPRVAVGRTWTVIAKKGGRPEAALSIGRKRPRRAYTGVNPHRAPNLRRRRDVVQQSKDLPPCAVYEAEHPGLKEVSNREDETFLETFCPPSPPKA
jgi:hypothetical protein